MSEKVKPWHQRKPKRHDGSFKDSQSQGKRKKVVPLRTGSDERLSPLRVDDIDNDWDDERWES